jgi:nucleotide-binding universal stress UspA family protein
MYHSVMVPLDGSPFGEHALPLAQAIARRAGARLDLVNVVPPLAPVYAEGVYFGPVGDLEGQLESQQRDYLARVGGRLTGVDAGSVRIDVLRGEVTTALLAHAEKVKPDLVVMATHARGPMGRFWLGSVADEMVRQLAPPVLLVRPREEAVDLAREPELGRVLLPLDGTGLAEQMIEPAVALGGLMAGSEFILMRVIEPVVPVSRMPDTAAVDHEARTMLREIRAIQDRLHAEAEAYLEKIGASLRGRGLKVQTRVGVEEQPAVAILHETEARGVGLIALATHGRRGLARLLMGSVADKVIRAAHVPVLVRRPTKA